MSKNEIEKPGLAELPQDVRLRGFRYMVISAIFAVVGTQIFGGNILWLIVLNLGGSEQYIGFLSFIIFSASLIQLFIVSSAQRIRKKIFILLAIGSAYISTLPIPFVHQISIKWSLKSALFVLALCVAFRQMWMYIATPSWMGLLREMTPENIRGRLIGILRTSWQSSVVVTLILTGIYLGREPDWIKLRNVMVVGLLAQLVRWLMVIPVPSPPQYKPKDSISWKNMLAVPLKDKVYQPFLIYIASYGFAFGIAEPFKIVYLVKLGFGQNLSLISASFFSIGAICTLIFWGKIADRFGNRGVFTLTLIGLAVCSLGWSMVHILGLSLAMLLFFGVGAFSFGNGLVQTRYMFSALKPEYDASYIALASLTSQCAVGLGSLVGGYILKVGELIGLTIKTGTINNYHLLFVVSFTMFLLPISLRKRLREASEKPTKEVLIAITQPIRNLVGAFIYWPKGRNDNRLR